MENKIPLIALAVFSISLLFMFNFITRPAFAETITWYNQATGSTFINFGTNIKMWGEGAVTTSSVLYNKPINGLTLMLSKTGSPTGNVTFGVWSNSTVPTYTNPLYVIGNISATTLTTTPTLYQLFNLDDTHVVSTGQSIGAFHGGSTAINFVTITSCFTSPNGCIDTRNSAVLAYRATGGGWGPPEYAFDIRGSIFFTDEDPEPPVQPFCALPENANILTCRLELQGNTGLAGTSQLVNQSATNIACQVGIIACTQDPNTGDFVPDNPDVKTNGIGYLIVAIAMGIFVGLLWVASRGQMTEIPTFVWFIGTIAIVGAFTAIQYIDPTFLIITVITVIAFAVAKAKGVFGEVGGLFKGESI